MLAWGRRSPYAEFFDIQWHSADPLLADGELLLPLFAAVMSALVLGEPPRAYHALAFGLIKINQHAGTDGYRAQLVTQGSLHRGAGVGGVHAGGAPRC